MEKLLLQIAIVSGQVLNALIHEHEDYQKVITHSLLPHFDFFINVHKDIIKMRAGKDLETENSSTCRTFLVSGSTSKKEKKK